MSTRPLNVIAAEIAADWPRPYFGAVPYLRAMFHLSDINSSHGYDGARSIVGYFLSNARNWRGVTARRIKTELKGML